jgi:hypothetical protein
MISEYGFEGDYPRLLADMPQGYGVSEITSPKCQHRELTTDIAATDSIDISPGNC